MSAVISVPAAYSQMADAGEPAMSDATQQPLPPAKDPNAKPADEPATPDMSQNSSTGFELPQSRSLLIYGASVSQGETAPGAGDEPDAGAFILFSPRAEILITTRKMRFALTSAPIIAYQAVNGTFTSVNGIFDPSVDLHTSISPRWTWIFQGGVTAGQEFARLYAANQPSCEPDTCVQQFSAGPDMLKEESPAADLQGNALSPASGAPVANLVTTNVSNLAVYDVSRSFAEVAGATGFRWQRTRTESLLLAVGESYSLLDNISVASAKIQSTDLVTPFTSLTTYGHVHQYQFEDAKCTSYGAGAGFAHQFGRGTLMSGEAGPEYGSRGCGRRVGLDFNAGLQTRISERLIAIFSASRDLNAAYAAGNRWFDTFLAGVDWKVERNFSAELSGGYFHTGGPLGNAPTFSGYTISPQIRWHVNPQADLVAAYHYYQRVLTPNGTPSAGLDRGFFLLTLSWHPRPVHF